MLVPLTVRLPADAVTLLATAPDHFSAELEVRVAAIDDRGDRSEVVTLPWHIVRTQRPETDETLEFATALRMRRRPQELVVAVYDTRTGELFSSSTQVRPLT